MTQEDAPPGGPIYGSQEEQRKAERRKSIRAIRRGGASAATVE